MLTNIVKSTNGPIFLLCTDDRLPHEVMHQKVTGCLELHQAPGHMPDFGPHVLPLRARKLCRVVAIARNSVAPQQGRISPVHGFGVDRDIQNGNFKLRFVHDGNALCY
ncbi:MAG: Uncharacterised protein [Halieaceae bacterium]|nr:MAG: Uncharacterised protein [Halieaceae bacterium]